MKEVSQISVKQNDGVNVVFSANDKEFMEEFSKILKKFYSEHEGNIEATKF